MKIDVINIISLCNFKHQDFGVFASFLSGLAKNGVIEVPQPHPVFLCEKCKRPLWMEKMPCLYCLGKKDGQKLGTDCEHTWTVEEKIHCIKCGIFKSFLEKV
jgi:hypothetical protein